MTFNFEVKSQTEKQKKYVVRMKKELCHAASAVTCFRDLISCGCPGHTLVLAKAGDDALCKHCGAVLLCCLYAHPHSQMLIQPQVVGRIQAPRARSPTRPAKVTLAVESPKPVFALEDEQLSEPGLEPAASAVTPKKTKFQLGSAADILHGYDQHAEEAAELLVNGGRIHAILSSKQAQKMGIFLLGKAKVRAILTAFTFDLLTVNFALKEAAHRDVQVQLYVDKGHSLKGTTAAQMDRLDDLRKNGVEVYLVQGIAAGGIQHSKSLFVDGFYMCGSTNWTTSSRSNHEVSVLMELSEEGETAVMQKLGYIMQGAELLTSEKAKASQLWRDEKLSSRGRSVGSESDRTAFSTARRFSIARARSREAALGM